MASTLLGCVGLRPWDLASPRHPFCALRTLRISFFLSLAFAFCFHLTHIHPEGVYVVCVALIRQKESRTRFHVNAHRKQLNSSVNGPVVKIYIYKSSRIRLRGYERIERWVTVSPNGCSLYFFLFMFILYRLFSLRRPTRKNFLLYFSPMIITRMKS